MYCLICTFILLIFFSVHSAPIVTGAAAEAPRQKQSATIESLWQSSGYVEPRSGIVYPIEWFFPLWRRRGGAVRVLFAFLCMFTEFL